MKLKELLSLGKSSKPIYTGNVNGTLCQQAEERDAERKRHKSVDSEDENTERGNWSGKLDFILSMLGYSVGLGNVWRFPYLCYKNGGGVFLIPYLISMTLIGLPMFFLEVSLGQFSSQGTMSCWGFAPLFKGLGFAMVFISAVTCIYYNVLLAYSFTYLFSSFTSYLPWSDCDNSWNSDGCSLKLPVVNCTDEYVTYDNGTCYNGTDFAGLWNITVFQNITGIQRVSPSEEYFNNELLGITSGIEDLGGLQWKIVLALMLAWVLTFLCLLKGIKTTGKVVYVTATFPYLILTILLIRGVMLPGAMQGIEFYIKPDWAKLGESEVWRDAATQIFYSMGMGWGGLHALSSYNKFNNNCLRDALIVSIGTCTTSIFAGFVVFSYLGVMAASMSVEVSSVATSGPGLAFIVYPEAFTYLPCPTVWSILFFVMLLTVGLDSQFVTLETVLTSIHDEFVYLRSKKIYVLGGVCSLMFLLSLPIVSQGGIYILQLLDTYTSFVGLPVICLLEAIAVAYIYGSTRFYNDIRVMIGKTPSNFWRVCWMVLNPIIITFVLIFTLVQYKPFKYGEHYFYPDWAVACAWILTLCPIVLITFAFIYSIATTRGNSLIGRVKSLVRPTREWGPYLTKHRMLVDYVDDFVVDPRGDLEQPLTDISPISKHTNSQPIIDPACHLLTDSACQLITEIATKPV